MGGAGTRGPGGDDWAAGRSIWPVEELAHRGAQWGGVSNGVLAPDLSPPCTGLPTQMGPQMRAPLALVRAALGVAGGHLLGLPAVCLRPPLQELCLEVAPASWLPVGGASVGSLYTVGAPWACAGWGALGIWGGLTPRTGTCGSRWRGEPGERWPLRSPGRADPPCSDSPSHFPRTRPWFLCFRGGCGASAVLVPARGYASAGSEHLPGQTVPGTSRSARRLRAGAASRASRCSLDTEWGHHRVALTLLSLPPGGPSCCWALCPRAGVQRENCLVVGPCGVGEVDRTLPGHDSSAVGGVEASRAQWSVPARG